MNVSDLKKRAVNARNGGGILYLTPSEYTELKRSITPLPNATVERWQGVNVKVSTTLAVKHSKKANA